MALASCFGGITRCRDSGSNPKMEQRISNSTQTQSVRHWQDHLHFSAFPHKKLSRREKLNTNLQILLNSESILSDVRNTRLLLHLASMPLRDRVIFFFKYANDDSFHAFQLAVRYLLRTALQSLVHSTKDFAKLDSRLIVGPEVPFNRIRCGRCGSGRGVGSFAPNRNWYGKFFGEHSKDLVFELEPSSLKLCCSMKRCFQRSDNGGRH